VNFPIYLDTNVLMDFFLNRDSGAYSVIKRAIKCEFHILISPVVLEELHKYHLDTEAKNFVMILQQQKKITICPVTEEDKKRARTYPTHYQDALHKAVAEKHTNTILTKNVKDFKCFTDMKIRRPDDI
jgi:predicted nucleic acid-binding protein